METDRPAREDGGENCEIEITPEMIEAGVMAVLCSDRRVESSEDIISKIYSAMVEAKEWGS
jgi:hypothetical protein